MENKLIGRQEEQEILQSALESSESEMVAVIGRRRVGKTFLVNAIYQNRLVFEITGIRNASLKKQLRNFRDELQDFDQADMPIEVPTDWVAAFRLLKIHLKKQGEENKRVLFFDEVPWLSTRKSGFLEALGYFWNHWASRQNLVVVICGSAASWMIQKIVNARGGLHNRITKRIYLQPFTLAETAEYLKSRNYNFDRYHIIQLYMAMGGVPHYLKEIKPGLSAVQNIEKICFSKNGLLQDEFSRLYESLFANAENHITIIRTLFEKRQGLTRKQLVADSNLSDGGTLTKVIRELLQSGFISIYRPLGKQKKEKLYRLTDEYSLFYLQFIEGKEHEGNDIWQHLSQTQEYKSWSGYAFENICLKHIPQIKKALSIAGVYSLSASFYKKGTASKPGIQVDLLIDRNDHVINLFEIKFHNKIFTISKEYAERLRQKKWIFEEITKSKKYISWIFISTFGLKWNQHSTGLVEKSLTMDDLFEN